MELTKPDLALARKCVKASLELRTSFVATFKHSMENTPRSVEPQTKRMYMRFVAVEIPQLTALLKTLKGK